MDDYDDFNSTRPRWLRAAAICLGTVVAAAAAFGVGRWSAPASGGGQQTTVSSQSGPGPWRVENGVPVGYAHTPDGAVAAATSFLMVVDGPLVTQPEKYRKAIDTLAAPDATSALRSNAENDIASLQSGIGLIAYAQQGRTVVYRPSPLAYHVDQYDGKTPQISIWAESLIAIDGALSLRETWSTTSLTVEWVAGDRRLSAIASPTPDSFGPVPTTTQPGIQSLKLPPQLVNYRSYTPDVGP